MHSVTEREIIVRLYAAACGEGSWSRALDAIGAGLSARTVVLFSRVSGSADATFLGGTGIGPEAAGTYLEYFCAGEAICQPWTLLSHQYGDDLSLHLAAFRLHDDAAFGAEDRLAISALSPHLRCAAQLAARLESATAVRDALLAVGDQLGRGLALLDASGHVLLTNSIFERLCAANDGLAVRRGIFMPSRVSASAVARLMAAVLRGESGGCVDVWRPSGCQPYSLLVSPVTHALSAIGTGAARLSLIVSDPAAPRGPSEEALSRRYGLTPAESRMAACVVGGATVGATADHLGISLNTARTHLKRAMAKAGVSRQAELVRLLLSSR
jgi:DNA-binding CsgD family transcriptional regulator